MKLGNLLATWAAVTQLGLCSSPMPANFKISLAEVQQREKSSLISSPLSSSESTELAIRDGTPMTKKTMGLQLLTRTALGGLAGYGLSQLIPDCQSLTQNATVGGGFKCGLGAIAAAIGIYMEGKATALLFYEFTRQTVNAVVETSVNSALRLAVGGWSSFTGPFARRPAGLGADNNVKRDENIFKRAEDHFSSVFGVEVRHIGLWDGSMHVDSQSEAIKRDQSQEGTIPVFGLNYFGEDIHFAYGGQNADGNDIIKIGTGAGPATEENKRLRARWYNNIDGMTPNYADTFFSQGGMDVLGDTNTDQDPDFSLTSTGDYDWLYTQLECLFGATRLNPGDKLPSTFDAIGLWFQTYDNEDTGTLAAGVISFFGPSTPSVIEYMQPSGGIPLEPFCSFRG